MKINKLLIIILTFLISAQTQAANMTPIKKLEAFKQAFDGDVKGLNKNLSALDINEKNERGETLTMAAAGNGQVDALKAILAKKPDLGVLDNEKHSALYYAISNEHPETAKLLIEAGADLKHLNQRDDNALILAASSNNAELIELLVKKDKTLINKFNISGNTALMESARFGNSKTLKILLDAGADKKQKNNAGKTALDIAKKAQNTDAVTLLSAK